MAAAANPDPHGLRRPIRERSLVWQVPAALILWLALINWPLPPTAELDPSWQQALVDAWLTQRQYGREIIFTFGPWGFLLSFFYLPDALTIKLAFEIVGKLCLAIFLVRLSTRLTLARRWIWLMLVGVFVNLYLADAVLFVVTAAIAGVWLLDKRTPALVLAASVASLGFLLWLKFGLTLFCAGVVGVACLAHVREGHFFRAFAIAGGFVVAALAFWTLAGQHIANVDDFFLTGFEIASGYQAAMALVGRESVLYTGLIVVSAFLLCLLRLVMLRDEPPARVATVLIVGAALAITWKHGFTRADGHESAFFMFVILILPLLPVFPGGRRLGWTPMALVPVALVGLLLATPNLARFAPSTTWGRIVTSAKTLPRLRAFKESFTNATSAQEQRWRFPRTRERVGTRTIDLIGSEQGILLLNGLNYRPRPVPQTYAAYTEELQRRNHAFLQSSSAPDFLLVGFSNVDGRYEGQEDARSIADLTRLYRPVLEEGNYILLERRPPPIKAEWRLTTALEKVVSSGEELQLPPSGGGALWLQIDANQTATGRLRSLAFQETPLKLVVTDDKGVASEHRLVRSIARSGMLIQPLLREHLDLVAYLHSQIRSSARSIRVEIPSGHSRYWQPLHVRVSQIDNLHLDTFDLMQYLVNQGVLPERPVSTRTAYPVRSMMVANALALFLHAPGEITFTVRNSIRRVSFAFGVLDGAFSAGGATDGVDFGLDLMDGKGAAHQLYQRLLQPMDRPADRGTQKAIIDIPGSGTRTVRLRTGPGPLGNGSWDWSYVSDVQLLP